MNGNMILDENIKVEAATSFKSLSYSSLEAVAIKKTLMDVLFCPSLRRHMDLSSFAWLKLCRVGCKQTLNLPSLYLEDFLVLSCE